MIKPLYRCLTMLVVIGTTWPVAAVGQDMIVKIGHVGPVSGAQAHYGKDNENGARMAIEDLNARGVTIGGKKVKLELVAEDDAADPKQGTAAAQKLCDAKVSGVVGHLNSGTTIPASTIYNECGIPHITPSATNPKLTRQGYRTTFALLPNDFASDVALATYATNVLKAKRVEIFDSESRLRDAASRGAADPKEVLLSSFCPSNFLSHREVACVEGGIPLDQMPGGKTWKDRYDKKYPGQFQFYSPYTYDAVNVLVDAMVRAGSSDPKVYISKLRDADYSGVTGRIAFSPSGESKHVPMTIYRLKDGRKVPGIVLVNVAPGTTCPSGQCYCKSDKKCKDKCDGCG